jgi:hypothetical protein
MSTLAEIEQAVEKLPPQQWEEIRRWMAAHAPTRGGEAAAPVQWLAASVGTATTGLSTDEIMRLTRGED